MHLCACKLQPAVLSLSLPPQSCSPSLSASGTLQPRAQQSAAHSVRFVSQLSAMEQRIRCKRYLRTSLPTSLVRGQISKPALKLGPLWRVLCQMCTLRPQALNSPQAAEHVSAQALSEEEIDGALQDMSLFADLLPLAPKTSAVSISVLDSDSKDLESWSVCSPQVSVPRERKHGLSQASQLLMPPNSPCFGRSLPQA